MAWTSPIFRRSDEKEKWRLRTEPDTNATSIIVATLRNMTLDYVLPLEEKPGTAYPIGRLSTKGYACSE
uniref:Uncharacterized protein n=1 Tax=Megaselia scalaris TaxID=36166 RepID=T1H4B0_MEGSC